MMRFAVVAIVATMSLALAAPTNAKKAIEVDPSAAYILVEVGHVIDPVFRGTKLPGSIALARYDATAGDIRGGSRSPGTALPKPSDVRAIQSRQIGKSARSKLYLMRVEPDTWAIEGASGTAFSLGSKTFVARAGAVIDFGVVTPAVDWAEGERAESMIGSSMLRMMLIGGRRPETRPMRLDMRARTAADIPVPAELAHRLMPVAFSDGATFGNYLGGQVNRIGGRATRTGTPQ